MAETAPSLVSGGAPPSGGMGTKWAVLAITLAFGGIVTADNSLPPLRNQFDYSRQRRKFAQAEARLAFTRDVVLDSDEVIVQHYLDYLIRTETVRFQNMNKFPPAHFFNTVKDLIEKSPLYTLLRKMPKGGNLHLHDGAMGDRLAMLKKWHHHPNLYIYNRDDGDETQYGSLAFFTHPLPGYVPASTWGFEDIADLITMRKFVIKPGEDPWVVFQATYDRFKDFINFDPVWREWIRASMELAVEDNVQYMEVRAGFGKRFILTNSTKDGGQQRIDPSGEEDAQVYRDIIEAFIAEHPKDFVNFTTIYQVARAKASDQIDKAMKDAKRLKDAFPGFVAGFDLVGQEDEGFPLLWFLKDFQTLYTDSKGDPDALPFYLHVGESNWEWNSAAPNGVVKPVDNFYEALLLNARRFGHGLALYKRPYLWFTAMERDVALEICPISNQILGYHADLRTHPADGYLRSGLQGVLASDDPGVYGYLHLSFDFFEAALSFGLELNAFKKLINNSFAYSALSGSQQARGIDLWTAKWRTFIADTKAVACAPNAIPPLSPEFHFLFPNLGPVDFETTVEVWGRNLSNAICGSVKCRFGDVETEGRYMTAEKIECFSPRVEDVGSAYVSVSLDGGRTYVNTTFLFYYGDFPSDPDTGLTSWEWALIISTAAVAGVLILGGSILWIKRRARIAAHRDRINSGYHFAQV